MIADAHHLPFRSGTFDLLFTSPPWDHLDLLHSTRDEFSRVLTKRGRMLYLLPNLDDRSLATLLVTNRDHTERQAFAVDKPSEEVGPRYYSPNETWVEGVLRRFPAKRLLDPFCGVGTIPRVARRLGIQVVGCDIDAVVALSP